jgi:hypothetical protein
MGRIRAIDIWDWVMPRASEAKFGHHCWHLVSPCNRATHARQVYSDREVQFRGRSALVASQCQRTS